MCRDIWYEENTVNTQVTLQEAALGKLDCLEGEHGLQ